MRLSGKADRIAVQRVFMWRGWLYGLKNVGQRNVWTICDDASD